MEMTVKLFVVGAGKSKQAGSRIYQRHDEQRGWPTGSDVIERRRSSSRHSSTSGFSGDDTIAFWQRHKQRR